jgi:hypothetical protein
MIGDQISVPVYRRGTSWILQVSDSTCIQFYIKQTYDIKTGLTWGATADSARRSVDADVARQMLNVERWTRSPYLGSTTPKFWSLSNRASGNMRPFSWPLHRSLAPTSFYLLFTRGRHFPATNNFPVVKTSALPPSFTVPSPTSKP